VTRRRLVLLALVALAGMGASVPSTQETTRLGPDLFTLVEGTTWEGDDGSLGPGIFTFAKGGILEYSYRGRSGGPGTWTQKENVVYFEINRKYREFEGRMKDDVITGKAWNRAGTRWDLTLKRKGRK
jgi:hypothetical protein